MYLSLYSRINSIDYYIKNCHLFYQSWKYWHSPILHGKALAVVTMYDMYREVTIGNFDAAWKFDKRMDFDEFRDQLSIQMLQYSRKHCKYPGDKKMWVSTQQGESQRPPGDSTRTVTTPEQFFAAKNNQGENSQLCGDLTQLIKHFNSMEISLHDKHGPARQQTDVLKV